MGANGEILNNVLFNIHLNFIFVSMVSISSNTHLIDH